MAIASCVPGMFAIRVSPQNRAPEPAAARLRSAPRPPGPGIEVMFFLQPAPISRPASGGPRATVIKMISVGAGGPWLLSPSAWSPRPPRGLTAGTGAR